MRRSFVELCFWTWPTLLEPRRWQGLQSDLSDGDPPKHLAAQGSSLDGLLEALAELQYRVWIFDSDGLARPHVVGEPMPSSNVVAAQCEVVRHKRNIGSRAVTIFDRYGDTYTEKLNEATVGVGDTELFAEAKATAIVKVVTRLSAHRPASPRSILAAAQA